MNQDTGQAKPEPPASPYPGPTESIASPVWAHVIPFVAWLFLLQMLGDPAGWKYAVRTIACLGLFLAFRPWQYYRRLRLQNLPLAVVVGVGVFAGWVLFETAFMNQWPAVQEAYRRFAMWPPWRVTDIELSRVYAPETCGWPLTIVRILGSAFVIGIIEEFFWRGFIYRWALEQDFLSVDLGRLDWKIFLVVALFFGLEHTRWLAGFATGIVYGLMVIKTRDIWAACIAHAITNLLLGVYVVWADQYVFWS